MENQREPPKRGDAVLLEWYSHRAGRILGRICPDMVAAWSWAVRLFPRGIDRESIRFTIYKGAHNGET